MSEHAYFKGVLCALGAGLTWGLVFVAPQILADYPPAILAFGRYVAFGLICLPLAWRDRRRLGELSRKDWLAAFELALIGNICYYLCLAAAIQYAGGPLPALIIGTLPVVIAVCANLRDKGLPWLKLLPSMVLIGAGLLLAREPADANASAGSHFASGILLACVALACWTWYPIRNAHWLKRNPTRSSATWATAQGLATLPLALVGYVSYGTFSTSSHYAMPFGPRPLLFIALMLVIGLLASWLGTLLWNRACQLLPTALSGQLIVFETLAALTYGFLWLGHWPSPIVASGIILLVGGVLFGVRSFRHQAQQAATV